MATAKTEAATQSRKASIAELREQNVKLKEEVEKLKHSAYCPMCNSVKDKSKFYVSTDPLIKGGVTNICKMCALGVAERIDKNGE